jgi:hypothetical protein
MLRDASLKSWCTLACVGLLSLSACATQSHLVHRLMAEWHLRPGSFSWEEMAGVGFRRIDPSGPA